MQTTAISRKAQNYGAHLGTNKVVIWYLKWTDLLKKKSICGISRHPLWNLTPLSMPWLNRLNAKDVPESHHLRQVSRLLSRGPHWFKAEVRNDQSVIEAGCVYLYPYSPGTNTRSTCDFFSYCWQGITKINIELLRVGLEIICIYLFKNEVLKL